MLQASPTPNCSPNLKLVTLSAWKGLVARCQTAATRVPGVGRAFERGSQVAFWPFHKTPVASFSFPSASSIYFLFLHLFTLQFTFFLLFFFLYSLFIYFLLFLPLFTLHLLSSSSIHSSFPFFTFFFFFLFFLF